MMFYVKINPLIYKVTKSFSGKKKTTKNPKTPQNPTKSSLVVFYMPFYTKSCAKDTVILPVHFLTAKRLFL